MSILDTIRSDIGSVFSDTGLFFSEATLTRVTGGGGWTEGGTPATYPCKAMLSAYHDHLRAVADIPDTDAKMLIVGTSITVDPMKGDAVTASGRDWSIINVKVDPAGAMWACQVRPV